MYICKRFLQVLRLARVDSLVLSNQASEMHDRETETLARIIHNYISFNLSNHSSFDIHSQIKFICDVLERWGWRSAALWA